MNFTAQLYRYLKTIKERDQRIKGGKNEEHRELCKRNRRISTVSRQYKYTYIGAEHFSLIVLMNADVCVHNELM